MSSLAPSVPATVIWEQRIDTSTNKSPVLRVCAARPDRIHPGLHLVSGVHVDGDQSAVPSPTTSYVVVVPVVAVPVCTVTGAHAIRKPCAER